VIESDPLDIALRAYTEPVGYEPAIETQEKFEKRVRRLLRYRRRDNYRPALMFDFETRSDPAQRPMLGAYRFCRWEGGRKGAEPRLVCLLEGLIYADDLTKTELETLRSYWRRYKLRTGADQSISDSAPALWLTSEQEFVRMIYRACFEPGPARAAALVGLNVNFDVSRLAVGWGGTRPPRKLRDMTKFLFANGFSLTLHEGYVNVDGEHRESPHHPRYLTKHLSSTKSHRGFGARFSGHIIDVRQIAFALTNRGHSLETGCEAFKVEMPEHLRPLDEHGQPKRYGYRKRDVDYGVVSDPAIDYCREDVLATQLLYAQLIRDADRHPIPVQVSQWYSPASVGKGYLAGMRIRPRLERQPDFPREQLGIAMSAFYGGRTEARIIRVPVPVVYCDLLSAYTTGNSLMDLWRFVVAERVALVDATAEVRQLVNRIDLDDCLNPETWRSFPVLVQIKPAGDVFPVRGRYQKDRWNIGSNYLTSDEPLWYALPEAIASKLITGRAPEIVRAFKLVPVGVQPGIKPIKLRGEIEIDPRENFFQIVVERRHELPDKDSPLGQFLKTLASAASYGIYAEMVRSELGGRKTARVSICDWTGEPYELDRERNPERPGRYFFAPLAATITAGTRLLLAISERLLSDAGGTWAMMDTDSVAMVSTEHGGLVPCPGGPERDEQGRECVRALSWAQVDAIRARMRPLNPYRGRAGENSILELEDENFTDQRRIERRQLHCLVLSSKRYSMFNLSVRGEPELRIATEPDRHAEEETIERTPVIRKRSDHGLGYLINPIDPDSSDRDWILQGWEWIVRGALGLNATEPEWFDKPALMRGAITTQGLLDCWERWNAGKPRRKRMRPFNFFMVAQPTGIFDDAKTGEKYIPPVAGKCALILPFESNSDRWELAEAFNRYNPRQRFKITTNRNPYQLGAHPDLIAVRTLCDVFHSYRDSIEHKSLAPDGKRCTSETRGLLRRRHLNVSSIVSIGKEMNALEDQLSGTRQSEGEWLNTYRRPGEDPLWQPAREVILTLAEPVERTARSARVSARSVKRARAHPGEKAVWIATNERGDECGHHHRHFTAAVRCCRRMERHYRLAYAGRPGYPKRETWVTERASVSVPPAPVGAVARDKLVRYALRRASTALRVAGIENVRAMSPHAILATWLDRQQPTGVNQPKTTTCQSCGQPIRRATRGPWPKWCSDKCRKRAARRTAGRS
jgi:hypothetical protein